MRDSKDIPEIKREFLCKRVEESCLNYHILKVEAKDIDKRRAAGESMNQIKTASVVELLRNVVRAAVAGNKPIDTVYIDAYDGKATKHNDEYMDGILQGFADFEVEAAKRDDARKDGTLQGLADSEEGAAKRHDENMHGRIQGLADF